MSERKIKYLDEQFAQSLNGEAFNSSNGVFKVNYKSYDDLSIPVGRGPDPSLLIKDSVYKNGDIVKGHVKGFKKKIKGEVIEVNKSADGKFYIIKIQTLKDKKNYTLVPGSIEFIQDRGNSINNANLNISTRQKNAQNLKYNGGSIVWGSMEGNTIGSLYGDVESNVDVIEGPIGTGWRIKFIDEVSPEDKPLFNSFVIDPKSQLISCLRSNNTEELKNQIKAMEAYCFAIYNEDLKDKSGDLKCLIAIILLEMKNENEAKKYLIQKFPEISQKSYGEIRDEYLEEAKTILNSFLPS